MLSSSLTIPTPSTVVAPLLSVGTPDYSSIEVPEIATTDMDTLMGQLAENAGALSTGMMQGALDLANNQADANVSRVNTAFANAVKQTEESYVSLSNMALAQTMSMMDTINPGWSDALKASSDVTAASSNAISMYMAANLPTMMKQGADLAEAQGKLAGDLLAGKIPDDVTNLIKTKAAETAQQFGIFGSDAGGAGRAMEARDLGLTSLQLQGAGASMAEKNADLWSAPALSAAAMASAAQAPISTLLDQQKSLLPNVDLNALFNDAYDSLVKESTVSPDTVFQGALDSYNNALGLGLDVYKTNTEAQGQYDSMMMQFETDKMNAEVAAYNAELAANVSLQGAAMNANAIQNAATTSANATLKGAWMQANAAATANDGSPKTTNKSTTWKNVLVDPGGALGSGAAFKWVRT